ncbi:MAG TPA: hypothetical protein VIL04_02880 [Solirubrobacterales bacterium]
MIERWAGFARRQPSFAVAIGLGLVAVAFGVARTAPQELPVGSLVPEGEVPGAGATVLVTTPDGVGDRVRDVALEAIQAQLETDPNVASVQAAPQADGALAFAIVPSDPGPRAMQETAARLRANLDPGPLRFDLRGEAAAIADARHELGGDLWRAELPALAAAALIAALALGAAGACAALGVAALALLGTLAALRSAALLADVSLLAIAAAAPVALALGFELIGALRARYRDAQALGAGSEGARLALTGFAGSAAIGAAAAATAPLAVLALPLGQGGSLAAGCACAALLALAGALLFGPVGLTARSGAASNRPRVPAWPRTLPRLGARARALALCALAALGLALAAPALGADSHAFAADGAGSLATDLPLAAGLALAICCAVPAAALRAPRALLLAPVTLLPACAGLGVAVALADGWVGSDPFDAPLGGVENSALASGLCAVLAVSAARTARACALAAEAGPVPHAAARKLLGREVGRPAVLGTLVAGLACAALLWVDHYVARQFGTLVATGLVVDALVAQPLTAALAPRLVRRGRRRQRRFAVVSPVR